MFEQTIYNYDAQQNDRLIEIFYTAVHHIDSNTYTTEQKRAWAPYPIDYAFWYDRLSTKQPWMAWFNNKLVGFIELDNDGYIDCLYVDPQYQGQGIATSLYNKVITIAQQKRLSKLYVHASYIARPVFLHWGFRCIQRNEVRRKEQVLVNFTMEKCLAL
tara:strand:- start:3383 stop:3859 length:477 start_codon:yes stop_codon:yes gene_type:complete